MNSNAKGKRIEREAATYLRKLGFEARRGVQYQGGTDSPDVCCDQLANVHIEVKGDERVNLDTKDFLAAYVQAVNDSDKQQAVALLWRNKRTKWRLTFETEKPRYLVTIVGDDQIKGALRWLQDRGEEIEAIWHAECELEETPF